MTHREHKSVVIVGGGQAGLSVSYYLCQEGLDHVVLERHKKFHSWRVNSLGYLLPRHAKLAMSSAEFPISGQRPGRLYGQGRNH